MAFEAYEAFDDPYSYKGTGTLKNKLGLRDPVLLESFELEMTAIRANEALPDGRFGPAHYRRVHHHLFQDVYGWAGKYRNVRLAKGGNPFCFPEHIAVEMGKLFIVVEQPNVRAPNDSRTFVENVAAFLGELNAIHPFREGNGRTQLAFVAMLGERAGCPFEFTRVQRSTFLPAMIASYDRDLGPLIKELTALLRL